MEEQQIKPATINLTVVHNGARTLFSCDCQVYTTGKQKNYCWRIMNRCLYVNSEEKLSTTQNSLNCADNCVTDFKYPDDPFFTEETKSNFYNAFRIALHKLDDKSQTIVFTKALNPELSLREVSKVAGISYEGVRLKLRKIEMTYPMIYRQIKSRRFKRYFLDTEDVIR